MWKEGKEKEKKLHTHWIPLLSCTPLFTCILVLHFCIKERWKKIHVYHHREIFITTKRRGKEIEKRKKKERKKEKKRKEKRKKRNTKRKTIKYNENYDK